MKKKIGMKVKTKPFLARHGDVLIVPSEIPDKAIAQKINGDLILAYGEVSNHSHRISEGAKLFKFDDKIYMRVAKRARLVHEEHKALEIPAGDYEIKIQTDYSPDGWKKVQD